MKVSELIDKLRECPPDALVVVPYSGTDIDDAIAVEILDEEEPIMVLVRSDEFG